MIERRTYPTCRVCGGTGKIAWTELSETLAAREVARTSALCFDDARRRIRGVASREGFIPCQFCPDQETTEAAHTTGGRYVCERLWHSGLWERVSLRGRATVSRAKRLGTSTTMGLRIIDTTTGAVVATSPDQGAALRRTWTSPEELPEKTTEATP